MIFHNASSALLFPCAPLGSIRSCKRISRGWHPSPLNIENFTRSPNRPAYTEAGVRYGVWRWNTTVLIVLAARRTADRAETAVVTGERPVLVSAMVLFVSAIRPKLDIFFVPSRYDPDRASYIPVGLTRGKMMKRSVAFIQLLVLLVVCSSLGYASTATGGAPLPADENTGAPTGSFGVSTNALGPYTNDRPEGITSSTDERIVRVPPGGTFYVQVAYEDPDGITSISVNLVNSNPPELEGSLSPDQGGFEIVDVTTDTCDLSGTATAVTCVYTIQVAAETQNIDQLTGAGEEFAYVLRTRVTDGAGNVSNEAIRGYVVVGAGQ